MDIYIVALSLHVCWKQSVLLQAFGCLNRCYQFKTFYLLKLFKLSAMLLVSDHEVQLSRQSVR